MTQMAIFNAVGWNGMSCSEHTQQSKDSLSCMYSTLLLVKEIHNMCTCIKQTNSVVKKTRRNIVLSWYVLMTYLFQ